MLLVLALLVTIGAIAWPSLNRSLDTQRLKRGADLVRTHLLRARTKAITSGEIVSFRHQIDGSQFRIEQQSNYGAILESGAMAAGGSPMGGATGMGAGAANASSSGGASSAASLPPVEEQLPEGVKFLEGQVGSDPRMGSISINDRFTSINDAAWSQPILFFPDGTSTGATIRVQGERERMIEIELRALTGGVRVGEIGQAGERRR